MPGNVLRGEYGRWRANNDLLSYHLDIRVDPAGRRIGGKNTIRMKMLAEDTRIQLDLAAALEVEKIVLAGKELTFERDSGAVFVDFPRALKVGEEVVVEFYYGGVLAENSRGIFFRQDPAGRPWVYTSCEGPGASSWWPNKDQWKDEVEGMKIRVAVPNALSDVSNGKFLGKSDLGDGYTRWDWEVSYPINNYCVSINVGTYTHFGDKHGDMPLDFFVLPENLEKAKAQFAQAKGMLEAFEHYFGEYPFKRDGYKLVEVPYAGMEHQSAVTYGNRFTNGYLGRDWTGVGISPKFDFIIIHESGHEWFGNAVSAADKADMWIHEGWTTYLEGLYVEHRWGKAEGITYLNGYKTKVQNRVPIVARRGINAQPPQDQYFKGALFLNTLRSVVEDDAKWFAAIRGFYQKHKYQNIGTEEVVGYFNEALGMDLTAVFEQYLRHAALPVLELKFEAEGMVAYRWRAEAKGFAMPVRVGKEGAWERVSPTAEWQRRKMGMVKEEFGVDTEGFYVAVERG
jgi:aminopeptidase N